MTIEIEDWKDEDFPMCGREIEVGVLVGNKIESWGPAMWSDRPVCMLGSRNGGFPAGWATGYSAECDTNLPLDEPGYWREL